MTWPPQSPDLNPIEMVWGELDRRVKAKGPTSAKHLWELLQDCWKTISGDYLLKLIKRMPRVCKTVIKAKEEHFMAYKSPYPGIALFKNPWRWQTTSASERALQYKPGERIHGFTVKEVTPVPDMFLTAVTLNHEGTGAKYLHLAREDTNNLFSVQFRTTPMDSTGVPHILEHTVLCGSQKFPCRDPFFKMLNRSLSTFMNAFTANDDYTMYPFSTQNAKDFQNLLSVYLDAVFFSLPERAGLLLTKPVASKIPLRNPQIRRFRLDGPKPPSKVSEFEELVARERENPARRFQRGQRLGVLYPFPQSTANWTVSPPWARQSPDYTVWPPFPGAARSKESNDRHLESLARSAFKAAASTLRPAFASSWVSKSVAK
ncbi:unnamed protein product [Ranitomeya imitator]|uniref:Presequence protease, mitochondrial n=1 Tax=Ranitomeya imitator TaxID=111125 RepID=A0ABN9LKU8_9NEOB|nr:unnamed protein product [Ranitomeya imitator]